MSPRFIAFGAGAVGGVVAARLHQAGHDVALVARGGHLKAIQSGGLTLVTPVEEETFQIPTAADLTELEVGRPGDVVLLGVKSQDTCGALHQLRAARADDVPIVCLQNGVENERSALRRFADVYGAVVMAPTAHLEAGVVEASGARASGIIDIGRYPSGIDARTEELCAALEGARFISRPVHDIRRLKYAKLLLNLGNAVGALFADDAGRRQELVEQVRAEGRAALAAAGIEHEDPGVADVDARWEQLGVAPIAGRERGGSSTWQSLARGTGEVETDYLNGEIVLLGRLHGVPTPLNDTLCRLAADHARRGGAPAALALDEVRTALS